MAWMGMGIWWVLGLALLAVLIWSLLRLARTTRGSSDSAEDVLKRRYARGEIDRETYQRMLNDLKV